MLQDNVASILISTEELNARVAELGAQISQDYQGQDLLLLCVLKGGIVFLTDLMRCISIPHGIEFMAVSSYGNATDSSGIVRIVMDLETSIQDRHVLIVEDIVDTGTTLAYIKSMLLTRGPKSLRVCALLNKRSRREAEVTLDYVGFDIPNEFVIGYGLDYAEHYRNLRYVGILKPEVYRRD